MMLAGYESSTAFDEMSEASSMLVPLADICGGIRRSDSKIGLDGTMGNQWQIQIGFLFYIQVE